MEYRPETIDITELISRVNQCYLDLIADEVNKPVPDVHKIATINQCSQIFIKTISDMHQEEMNRITNKG